MTNNWRAQVIQFIKDKDRVMNPDQYMDQSEVVQGSNINQNLFDDCPEESDHDSSDSSIGSDQPLFDDTGRNNETNESSTLSNAPIDSSYDVSGLNAHIPEPLSKAASRVNAIDDELQRYGNFSKQEFSDLCTERGLTRNDPNIFEPIGNVTWEYWRLNKNKFPIIYGIIKGILQAPTSSSAIERLFSRVSGFVTPQKNRFKSKNLMALLQISEMDDFARVSADCFRQNGIVYDVEAEISSINFISNDESSSNDEPSTTNESTADDETEFDFSDILNYDF